LYSGTSQANECEIHDLTSMDKSHRRSTSLGGFAPCGQCGIQRRRFSCCDQRKFYCTFKSPGVLDWGKICHMTSRRLGRLPTFYLRSFGCIPLFPLDMISQDFFYFSHLSFACDESLTAVLYEVVDFMIVKTRMSASCTEVSSFLLKAGCLRRSTSIILIQYCGCLAG
jgi:hypothetical protein